MLTSIKQWSMYDTGLRSMIRKILMSMVMLILVLFLIPVPEAYAAERTVEIGIPVEEHPELFLPRSMPTRGEGKIAVFLIEFPDYKNDNPLATQELYEKIYFGDEDDPDYNWGQVTFWNGSVAGFYERESGGRLHLSGQVFDWYTAKHERSYYDNRKDELIIEAAQYYMSQGVNFSHLDGDGDSVFDAVSVHFAGEYGEDPTHPWYSGTEYSTAAQGGYGTIDDKMFKTFIYMSSNYASKAISERDFAAVTLPIVCHELMHSLGMMDLYSKAYFNLLPTTDLMTDNFYRINPYTKMLLGWVDRVRVVTEDTDDIRLGYYLDDAEEFVLVTKEYKGIFDEFYLVAWQYGQGTSSRAAVWHIDARLNADGSAFMNDNLTYNPRPDIDNPHATGQDSLYLFLEELCADPDYNFVLTGETLRNNAAYFGEGSAVGPNERLSSDTHDGAYTGIRMDDFKCGADGNSMTFDVSFVVDTVSPTLIVETKDIEFQQTVKLYFSENVYAAKNWEKIQVLDSQGNPLRAKVILPHYPNNRMEVTFETEDYRNGFSIVFPENCLVDSSGNAFAAHTLMKEATNRLYPEPNQTTQLPNTGGYSRHNANAHFFRVDDDVLIVTFCWGIIDGQNANGAKIEFMRLDRNGNVLSQTIVDNPFANAHGFSVTAGYQTAQDTYIFWSDARDAVFCMDEQGQLLWKRAMRAVDGVTHYQFEVKYQTFEGLVGEVSYSLADSDEYVGKYVLIRATDGEVIDMPALPNDFSTTGDPYSCDAVYLLSDGTHLRRCRYNISIQSERYDVLQLLASNAQDVLAEICVPPDLAVYSAFRNSDGTISVVIKSQERTGSVDIAEAWLLDADLRIIRSIELKKPKIRTHFSTSNWSMTIWLDNDGFIDITKLVEGNHGDSVWRIRRYDRYFNLVWETDDIANFVYFFMTPTGEVMAYRSMWTPERECYIDFYGSEVALRTEHTHQLCFVNGNEATCTEPGRKDYWYCTECGEYYTNQDGKTLLASIIAAPVLPHAPEEIPAVPSTCVTTGSSAGSKCSACGEILEEPQPLYNYGEHEFDEWVVMQEAACSQIGYQMRTCLHCGYEEWLYLPPLSEHEAGEWVTVEEATCQNEGYDILPCKHCGVVLSEAYYAVTEHRYGDTIVTREATCSATGEGMKRCEVCGEEQYSIIPRNNKHTYGEWIVLQEPYCTTQGLREHYCTVCGNREDEVMPPVGGAHCYFDAWHVIKESTCTLLGIEKRDCRYCDASETREIPLTDNHSYGEWTVVNAATCNVMGEEMRTCRDCGKKETRELPLRKTHAYGEWSVESESTCVATGTEIRKCADCDAKETRQLGLRETHAYGEWSVASESTCVATGTEIRKCADCGAEESRQLGLRETHAYGEWSVASESTCVATGTEIRKCADCGAKEIRQLGLRETHTYGEWSVESESTCVATGTEIRKCADCGAKETRQLGLHGTHAYGEWSVESESTCVATGTEIRKCADCGAKETRQLGLRGTHAYGEWSVASESTCDVHGTEVRRCADCGTEEFRELALRETHAYGEWYISQQSTCTDAGVEMHYCADCGTQEFRDLPVAEHAYGDWVVTREPTSERSGEESRKCVHCGNEETRAVAALPEADNKSDGSDNSNNSGNNSAVIIVIAIVVGVAAGCGCTVLLLRKRK